MNIGVQARPCAVFNAAEHVIVSAESCPPATSALWQDQCRMTAVAVAAVAAVADALGSCSAFGV